MQTIKENAANVGASAKSGLEKTKATMKEKVEKARSSDQMQKEIAAERKHERIQQADLDKYEARQHNAAAKQAGGDCGFTTKGTGAYEATGTHSTTGDHGYGIELPAGQVLEGTAGAHIVNSNASTRF